MLWSKSKVSETERTWWCSPFYLNLRLKQLHCDHEAWRWTINSTLNMTNGSRKGWNRSRDNGNDRNTYFASKYWRNQRAVYIHGGNNNGSKCLRLSLRFNEFIDLREILRGASAVKLGKCARFCVSWQSVYRPNVPVSIRMRGRASRIPSLAWLRVMAVLFTTAINKLIILRFEMSEVDNARSAVMDESRNCQTERGSSTGIQLSTW